jgi:hypothetical protein
MIFVFELNFHHFQKIKKLMLIRLLSTTLSPLGLTFFNSMLALLAIFYFPIISYLLLLDPLKNENKDFLGFYFF